MHGLIDEAHELRRVVDVMDHRVHQAQHARRVTLNHHVHSELHHFFVVDFHTDFALDPLEVLDHCRVLLEHPALKYGVCYMIMMYVRVHRLHTVELLNYTVECDYRITGTALSGEF